MTANGGDTPADPGALISRPIGVFDSGVGGLTVLRAIHARLPNESTVYLGDTARVPYGPKSTETVRRYALEAAEFLERQEVKAIVIACNTATARGYAAVVERSEHPVIGVVEPGARAAARASTSGSIGVIGTQGTIESATYETAIRRIRPDAEVHSAACPLFVALAEEGWTEGQVARLTAERYLEPLMHRGIDTLVLGCTHYPLLKPLLAEIADGVSLIDSAEATANALARALEDAQLARTQGESTARYYVTDDADRFRDLAERFLGSSIDHPEHAELG